MATTTGFSHLTAMKLVYQDDQHGFVSIYDPSFHYRLGIPANVPFTKHFQGGIWVVRSVKRLHTMRRELTKKNVRSLDPHRLIVLLGTIPPRTSIDKRPKGIIRTETFRPVIAVHYLKVRQHKEKIVALLYNMD